jgi:hypothetical protein
MKRAFMICVHAAEESAAATFAVIGRNGPYDGSSFDPTAKLR